MAFDTGVFSKVDFSKYQEWEQVQGSNGQTYYVIPGAGGYVYDPVISQIRGKKVIFINPTAKREQQEQAKKNAEKIQDAQLKQLDPVNQLIPAIAPVGALYAANKLLNPAGVAAATPAAPTIAGGSSGIVDSVTTGAGDIVNSISKTLGGGDVFSRAPVEVVPSLPTSLGTSAVQGFGGIGPIAPDVGSYAGLLSPGAVGGIGPVASGAEYGAMLNANPVAEAPMLQSSLGSLATPLGIAGVGYGGYQAFQGIKNHNPVQSGLGGLGAVAGLNALGYSLGPIGIAAAIGLPALASYLGGLGDKDMYRTEGNRLDDLIKQGYKNIPKQNHLTQGQSMAQLIENEKKRKDPNMAFVESRDENTLRAQDIQGYASLYERVGKDGSNAQRMKEAQDAVNAQKALGGGVIREHHGTIDVDWGRVDEWKKNHDANGPQEKNDATKVTGPINKAKPNKNAPVGRR